MAESGRLEMVQPETMPGLCICAATMAFTHPRPGRQSASMKHIMLAPNSKALRTSQWYDHKFAM